MMCDHGRLIFIAFKFSLAYKSGRLHTSPLSSTGAPAAATDALAFGPGFLSSLSDESVSELSESSFALGSTVCFAGASLPSSCLESFNFPRVEVTELSVMPAKEIIFKHQTLHFFGSGFIPVVAAIPDSWLFRCHTFSIQFIEFSSLAIIKVNDGY